MYFNTYDNDGNVVRSGKYDKLISIIARKEEVLLKVITDSGTVKKEMPLFYKEKNNAASYKVVYALGEEIAYTSSKDESVQVATLEDGMLEVDGSVLTSITPEDTSSSYLNTDKRTISDYILSLNTPRDIKHAIKKINRILDTLYENSELKIKNGIIYIPKEHTVYIRSIKDNSVLHRYIATTAVPSGRNEICRIDLYNKDKHIASKFIYLFEPGLDMIDEEENDTMALSYYVDKYKYQYEGEDEAYKRLNLINNYLKTHYLFAPPVLIEETAEGQYLFELTSDAQVLMATGEQLYVAISSLDDFSISRTYRFPISETEFTFDKNLIKMMGDPYACMWIETKGAKKTPLVFLAIDVEDMLNMNALLSQDYIEAQMKNLRSISNPRLNQTIQTFSGVESISTYDIPANLTASLLVSNHSNIYALDILYALLESQINNAYSSTSKPLQVVYDSGFKRLYTQKEIVWHYVGYDTERQQIDMDVFSGDFLSIKNYALVSMTAYDLDSLAPIGMMVFRQEGQSFTYKSQYVKVLKEGEDVFY